MSTETTTDWRTQAAAEYVERSAALSKQRTQATARLSRIQKKIAEIESEMMDLARGARAFGLAVDVAQDIVVKTESGSLHIIQSKDSGGATAPQFKDVALAVLKERAPGSMKAIQVQDEVESRLQRKFHWKTAGMTLYRLKKEGLVEREGQKWWAVMPSNQTDLDELLGPVATMPTAPETHPLDVDWEEIE